MNRLRSRAWLVLFGLGVIVAMFSAGAAFMGIDARDFEQSTGIAWSQFSASEPDVATYLARLERLIGVGYAVTGLLWAAIAFRSLRQGQRDAWYFLWTMPAVFGGASAIFLSHGSPGLGMYYGVFAILAIIGLAGSYPLAVAMEPSPG